MPGRTIAIGDIHGCSTALAALLEAVRPGPDDALVVLGDYIDRGPDSRSVLDQLITLGRHCRLVPLLGNHEEMLVGSLTNHEVLRCWLACGGLDTLASYGFTPGVGGPRRSLGEILPEAHWAFLAGCRPFYETDTHLFTHAGYVPDLPMTDQPSEALRWRSIDRRAVTPHCSGKTAVVGHTPQRNGEILNLGFLKCIDTHCHGGQWLTALEVIDGVVWQANQLGELRRPEGARGRTAAGCRPAPCSAARPG